MLLQKRSKKATQFVGLFRLFQFAWLFLVLDFCKYGPGKSWKSPGILMDQWCTNPVRTGVEGCSKIRRVLAKSRLILDEMCGLYGKFASYLRRVLCKTCLIFPRINGPIVTSGFVIICLP